MEWWNGDGSINDPVPFLFIIGPIGHAQVGLPRSVYWEVRKLCYWRTISIDIYTVINPRAFINPRRMREGYGSRSVCVCLLPRYQLHTWFVSLKYGVIRLLVASELYRLCGFSWKHSVQEFWCHLIMHYNTMQCKIDFCNVKAIGA